jgi:very-short-patch-repair endonuclease
MSITRARALRKDLTPFEARLWLALKQLRPQGLHFRRQSPRDGYILDFVCLKSRLIVELDGDQHASLGQQASDRRRDAHFADQGFATLRFWNVDVRENFSGVVETIFNAAIARRSVLDALLIGQGAQEDEA